jgi:lipid-binding SYLF domain-containing protein
LFLLLLTIPGWAASKESDEQSLRNASAVLTAMLDSKDIPSDVVAKAECIIVLPSVKKFAVGIGGTGGRGPLSCRGGKNNAGKWSAPAMYSVGGASAGFQVGGTATDYVLLLMSQTAVNKVLDGKVKVGTDVTAAAGPGASAPTKGSADVLTYSRTKGAFAGVSLSGATLDPDSDANKRLYGKDVSAKAIVLENAVEVTPGGKSLDALLNGKAATHTM